MANYSWEKYMETTTGEERRVYWRTPHHRHDAGLITSIKQWLGRTFGGTWDVRANSFQANKSAPPEGGVEYVG